ncbi:Pre-mRNA-splicing factor ATP-dependent RNA helicase PRP16 [Fusarium oxysporum f. sp. albedinis]|nr:Pre-mRNA-splicing factor ATP-dependent RNA helicase PRP16 [Fusarium oxysporum f. sp. albedinis]
MQDGTPLPWAALCAPARASAAPVAQLIVSGSAASQAHQLRFQQPAPRLAKVIKRLYPVSDPNLSIQARFWLVAQPYRA